MERMGYPEATAEPQPPSGDSQSPPGQASQTEEAFPSSGPTAAAVDHHSPFPKQHPKQQEPVPAKKLREVAAVCIQRHERGCVSCPPALPCTLPLHPNP